MSIPISERFSMRGPKHSRRRFFILSALGIPAAFFWVRSVKDRIDGILEYQSHFGTPVALDEDGHPVVKLGSIIPIAKKQNIRDDLPGRIPSDDTYAIIRKAPSENSRELLRVRYVDTIEIIEVLGDTYTSLDNRGQKYILPENGKAYGQWFQVTFTEGTGYLSGNFVTVLGLKEKSTPIEPPY